MSRLGNDLRLGIIGSTGETLLLTREHRDKHLYICGATGTGKSKFLESLIRQDIAHWRQSRSGLLLLDPHGNLYDSIMGWLAQAGVDRPVIPIDLRRDDWVVSYNVLRKRPATAAVIIDAIVSAMAHVWGATGTDQTPRFARWASNVLQALYERDLTLVEAIQLLDSPDIRAHITACLQDRFAQRDWEMAARLSVRDFENEVSSTINRLQRFLRNDQLRTMFGQQEVSLDLGAAIDEGAIVLVSLATERARISRENSDLFATLLLSDLWTAAQERGKRPGLRPFYVYLDEFQRFVTPTIADSLDEARGFGIHLTMAHQFPGQLLARGEHGRQLLGSVMENAGSKCVFRLSSSENLLPMAEWLFRGVLDPDQIKHSLYSTKVMGMREETRTSRSRGKSSGSGASATSGTSQGSGAGESVWVSGDGEGSSGSVQMNTDSSCETESSTESWSETESESQTVSSVFLPVFGKELSAVTFRTLEEQVQRAMQALFAQDQCQCVARLAGMRAPVAMQTATVSPVAMNPEKIQRLLERLYEKLPFSLPWREAVQRLAARQELFSKQVWEPGDAEPDTIGRRLPGKVRPVIE
jgi:hypothetical protein